MKKIIVVAGPTAVGKTKYAIEAAKAFNGEVISCDSMQLYKFMDIGSAKPTPDELSQVKHHLVDIIEPSSPFSVAQYQELALDAINDVFQRGKTPVIAGGTGLYLNSILYDMDFSNANEDKVLRKKLEKECSEFGVNYLHDKLKILDSSAAERIHPNNVKKVIRAIEAAISGEKIKDFKNCDLKRKDFERILIGLSRNRDELYDRINKRVDILVDEGLFDEVKKLLSMGLTENDISMKGIGYKEIIGYYENRYSREEAIELIKKNTRHLAKRQITWFKRYDDIHWLDISSYDNDEKAIEGMLEWLRNKF